MPRQRDYAYEALAEVTNSDANGNRGELNVALKTIREQEPELDSYLLSAEIHERAKAYRKVMGEALLTPTALAKHWKRVFEEARIRKPQSTNLSAETSLPLPKKTEVPEWCKVWYWLRQRRSPRVMFSLPQQVPHVDPTRCMSEGDYERYRGEWLEAGAPSFSVSELVAATARRNYAAEVGDLLAQINT